MERSILDSDLEEIFQRTKEESNHLKNTRILILGGTGFLGSWLVESLLYINKRNRLKLQVTAPARNPKKLAYLQDSSLTIIPHSFGSNALTPKGESYDFVFHALTPTVETDLSPVLGITNKLLDEIQSWKSPPRFVHLSSGAVYPSTVTLNGPIIEQEAYSLSELSLYGKLKLAIEQRVQIGTKEGLINGVNPRLFAFTGPRLPLDAHFAIGNFMRQGLLGEDIEVKGNSRTMRSYMHPVDAIVWILKCGISNLSSIFHIGSNSALTMEEIASHVARLFETGVKLTSENHTISRYVPETIKTQHLLNVKQEIGIENALSRWREWHLMKSE